jgi:pimeloyl-ACP methyl ester carboxylesterase
MLNKLRKLKYGARVLLSRGGGKPETIDVAGRPTVLIHGGEGPPFVYLHSSFGETFTWFPFYQTWAKEFRVLVPTHPGFGQSGGFEQIDTIEDMAFHYVEMFDALGFDEVILGGVSLGGWIAAEFAVRWPERVKKLWICNAPGLWVDEEPLPDLFTILNDRDKVRERMFHDPGSAMAEMAIPEKVDEQRMMAAYQAMTVLARLVWERPYDPKLAQRLRRVQCPVLLLWSANDQVVPISYGEAYRQHLPQAEWKVIPACGHLPMFEREAEFVAEVAQFAREKS